MRAFALGAAAAFFALFVVWACEGSEQECVDNGGHWEWRAATVTRGPCVP